MSDPVEQAMATLQASVCRFVEVKAAELAKRIDAAIAALPAPKDGAPGADAVVDYERVKALLVELIPPPVNGKDGRDAPTIDDLQPVIAAAAKAAAAALPPAKDGESVSIETVAAMVQQEVAALPVTKDGLNGINGKDGQDGQDGKDGADGRDALEIDILPEINPARVYARGTFARHRGGLVRATRATSPIKLGNIIEAGWETIVEGIAHAQVMQGDDLRTFALGIELTSGAAFVEKFSAPTLIYRELYRADAAYKTGDVVTSGGSMYVALKDTVETPGRSDDWRLAVKHGRDGRDWDAPGANANREPLRLR